MENSGRNISPALNQSLSPKVQVQTHVTPTTRRGHRAALQRASRACQNCRLRKVKCNLDATGIACGNCQEDEIECVVVESRRSRKYRREKRTQSPSCTSTQSQTVPPTITKPWYPASRTQILPSEASTNTVFSDASGAQVVMTPTEPPLGIDATILSDRLTANLPVGIRGPRQNFSPVDYQLLEAQGALTLPETSLRDGLLLSFMLYVHPYMPVLDLQRDILDAVYLQEKSPSQCSLLLFQAVMFAGSAFVDLRLLETLGFRSRRAARKALYSKAKLLYDFDWETDRITIIQSLLLMCYWYRCPEDQKDPWHWLGVCLSLGTSIGLNNHGHHLKLPAEVRRRWRRLWWMCILRDRILAITTRKPLRIREDDINIPFLTLDDFETEPISSWTGALLGSTLLCSSETRTTLARLCIEMVKLSLYSARVMTRTYTVTGHTAGTTDAVMLSWPKRDSYTLSEAVRIHHDLEQWQVSVPKDCVFSANLSVNVADARVLHVHRATLYIFSLITEAALYSPYLRTRTDSPSLDLFLENTVRPHLENMGSVASDIAEHLLKQDLVRYLHPLTVTFFLPPLVRLIGKIKCSRQGFRDKLEYQFRQCNRAMLQLRETWPIVDSACVIVEGLLVRPQVAGVPSATSAVFLDQDQPGDQAATMDANDQLVIPDNFVSTIETETTLPKQDPIPTSSVVVGEGISFPANTFDEILWSDIEPWFDQKYSPTGDLLWMDLALMDYHSLDFARPDR